MNKDVNSITRYKDVFVPITFNLKRSLRKQFDSLIRHFFQWKLKTVAFRSKKQIKKATTQKQT